MFLLGHIVKCRRGVATWQRLELQQNAEANARRDEIQLQRLQTEEQQSRQAISDNEISRQIAADKTTAQIQDDGAFAALIAAISSSIDKPDAPPSAVSLAALMRYANNSRYAEVLSAALITKSARVATLEEAQLCLRLAQAIQPPDFTLIAKMNRLARQKVEARAIHDFWRRYIPYADKMPPQRFLQQELDARVYGWNSLAHAGIRHDIETSLASLQQEPEVIMKIIEGKKSQQLIEPAAVEANTFLMEQTADVMARYIDEHAGQITELDISGCFLWQKPMVSDKVRVVAENTFFELSGGLR